MERLIKVATFAYILNKDRKVLIIRRAKHDSFPGRWELPGGGLDSGERPELSIQREVLEEVGLHVRAIRPISVITHVTQDNTKDIVRITYECQILNPFEKVILSAEHDAFQWIDEAGLKNIAKDTPLGEVAEELKHTYYRHAGKHKHVFHV